MRILIYDCFSGISGDMNLGAMIDLGVRKEHLLKELAKLDLEGWELVTEKDHRHGITGTKVTVRQTRHEHPHRHLSDIDRIIAGSDLSEGDKKYIFMKSGRLIQSSILPGQPYAITLLMLKGYLFLIWNSGEDWSIAIMGSFRSPPRPHLKF